VNLYEELLKYGFLTGSRAFGTNSDYDIVIPIYDLQDVKNILNDQNISTEQSNYFSGFKFSHEEKQINIIPVHPHEFLPWYLATKAMKASLKISGIKDRIKKHSIFMGIICLYKGMVEELKNIENYVVLNKSLIEKENNGGPQ